MSMYIINAIGYGLAYGMRWEVVIVDLYWTFAQDSPLVANRPINSFFLVSTEIMGM